MSAREQIIKTTCELIEEQGYHATGLNQIVKESGSPKGSLYHYFPGGKDELVMESLQKVGQAVQNRIETVLAKKTDPAEAISDFIREVAAGVAHFDFKTGGPITTVALETANTNERLSNECGKIYQAWHNAFAEKLTTSGLSGDKAHRLANVIIATLEGGIILSRTYKDNKPLKDIAEEIYKLIKVSI